MAKQKKAKKNIRKTVMDAVMILVLIVGIGALAYPFVQDSLNDFLDQQLITYYQNKANADNEEAMKNEAEMQKKNEALAKTGGNPGSDAFSDVVKKKKVPAKPTKTYFQKHTIGIIDLPEIHQKLPIFDETNDLFLEKGTSLLEGTSYPTGGKSTHAVISGHRGLPEAKLFTDLPEMKRGDQFYIHINKEIHAYQVDQLKVVEPTNTDYLHIEKDQDLVTLITCTPYMINSHRLLVRGHRVPYVPAKDDKKIQDGDKWRLWKQIGILGGTALAILLVLYLIYRWIKGIRIGNRRYLMTFTLLDGAGQPIQGETLGVYTKNGRRPVFRDQQPLTAMTDEAGVYKIEAVKGGTYVLKTAEGRRMKATIKKVKETQFSFKPKKAFKVIDAKKRILQIKA